MQTVQYGRYRSVMEVPDLVELQTKSYSDFLQVDLPPGKRKDLGLESLLREIFPIESYDKTMKLEYLGYELGRPRYTPDECRKLRLTYGYPFKVRLRLISALRPALKLDGASLTGVMAPVRSNAPR